MDTAEKEQLAQEQMDELKDALRDIDLYVEDLTINNTDAVGGSSGTDTITLSGLSSCNTRLIGSGYNYSGLNYPNSLPTASYTVNSNTGLTWANGTANITANPWSTTTAGRMQLDGDNADLVINGVSLREVLEQRLNVMIPNPALEKEWNQLKELGDQYRELEKDLKEKAEMWSKLNTTS